MPVHDDIFLPTGVLLESSISLHDDVKELRTPGGLRTVINRREEPLAALQVSYIGSTEDQRSLYSIIMAMRRGNAVLARNWSFWKSSASQDADAVVTNLDMKLLNPTTGLYTGDASTTVFRLETQDSPGAALTQVKRIRKPKTSSIVIAEAGIPLGPASISAATGEVTFSVAPGNGNAMTWGGEWWTPVYNASDDLAVQGLLGAKVTDTTGLLFMEEVLA